MPHFGGLPRAFWVLFAGTLVNRVGGFVLIFLAIYLTEERGLTPAQAGAVFSVYGLAAIAGGPIGGAASDRIGRRPTLVASLIAGGLSMLTLGLVTGTPAIVAAAAAAGLLYEMYRPVVAAAIADLVAPDDRARAFSLLYWVINIGAAAAPVLGGAIAAYSYRTLFIADATTTAAFGFIIWLALPETRPAPVAGAGAHADAGADGGMRTVFADRAFLTFCLLTLGYCIVFFQAFAGLPMDLRAHGITTIDMGRLFAINGVLIVLLQPWASVVIRGRSRPLVLAVGSLLTGIGYSMNAWGDGGMFARAGSIVVWTLGEILFTPASMSLAADLAPAHLRGRYQGVFSMAFTSGFAAAPAIGGYVIGHAGAWWLWVGCAIAGVFVAAGFVALGRRLR